MTDEEKLIVTRNYCKVLEKKLKINKDTLEKNQKLIYKLKEQVRYLKKKLERIENENNNNNRKNRK